MKTLTIKVTKKEIAMGVTARDGSIGKTPYGCRCPVARAIASKLDRIVWVACGQVCLWPKPELVIDLPERVQKWIKRFDNSLPCKPITFKLRIP